MIADRCCLVCAVFGVRWKGRCFLPPFHRYLATCGKIFHEPSPNANTSHLLFCDVAEIENASNRLLWLVDGVDIRSDPRKDFNVICGSTIETRTTCERYHTCLEE